MWIFPKSHHETCQFWYVSLILLLPIKKTFSANFGADFFFPTEYLLTHIQTEALHREVCLTKACFTLNFKINYKVSKSLENANALKLDLTENLQFAMKNCITT